MKSALKSSDEMKMLALLKEKLAGKPLLPDNEAQWIIDTFIWAFEHFDGQYFVEQSKVVLPTNEFFPGQVSSISAMAQQVFHQVVGFAGMQNWPIQLVAPQQLSGAHFPTFKFVGQSRGQFAQLVQPVTQPILISFNPAQINQPQDLVASFAQALAMILIKQKGVLPPGGEAFLPQATDLLAHFLGFGVMLTNTAYQFRGGCGSCYNPYANRQAALPETENIMCLALVSTLKGADRHKISAQLKPHLRSQYKKAMKQMAEHLALSPEPVLLALLEKAGK